MHWRSMEHVILLWAAKSRALYLETTLELVHDPVPGFCVRSHVCFPDLDSVVPL
jgi:hypothetical protein